jgi:transposase, IS6 family
VRWTYDTVKEQMVRQLMSNASSGATVVSQSFFLNRVRDVETSTPVLTYYGQQNEDLVAQTLANGGNTHDAANCAVRVHIVLTSDSNPGPVPFTALLHWRRVAVGGEGGGMMPRGSCPLPIAPSFAFSGFRFPPEVIVVAVLWYLRYGLSYRDVEALLAERGIEVDHVTVFRWVQRFTPLLVDAARPCRHAVGDRWFVDETYVKVGGRWRYLYRAVDQYGQIIDVYISTNRDIPAARRFLATALNAHGEPAEVVTDRAPALRAVIDELVPAAFHDTTRYREQSDRSRSRPTEGATPSDALTQTRPHRTRDHARPFAHAERASRALRTRC